MIPEEERLRASQAPERRATAWQVAIAMAAMVCTFMVCLTAFGIALLFIVFN